MDSRRNPTGFHPRRTPELRRIPFGFQSDSERNTAAREGAGLNQSTSVQSTSVQSTSSVVTNIKIGTKVTRETRIDLEIGAPEMATQVELERLAGMASKLRPDWPARSVRTYLEAKHGDRSYADLAVALAVLATDPKAETPKGLENPGPWWQATRPLTGARATPSPGPGHEKACDKPGHEHELARNCRACRGEELAGDQPSRAAGRYVPSPGLRQLKNAS